MLLDQAAPWPVTRGEPETVRCPRCAGRTLDVVEVGELLHYPSLHQKTTCMRVLCRNCAYSWTHALPPGRRLDKRKLIFLS